MASAMDKWPAAARLQTVAAARHLPTATSGSLNSYTTPGDTTRGGHLTRSAHRANLKPSPRKPRHSNAGSRMICHVLSCAPCAGRMFCGPSGHKGLLSCRGSRHSAGIVLVRVFGMGPSSLLPFRSVSAAAALLRRDPVSRVSRRRGRARLAPARFVRLIARASSADAPLPSAHAAAFLKPQPLSCAEKRKAAPEAASLLSS